MTLFSHCRPCSSLSLQCSTKTGLFKIHSSVFILFHFISFSLKFSNVEHLFEHTTSQSSSVQSVNLFKSIYGLWSQEDFLFFSFIIKVRCSKARQAPLSTQKVRPVGLLLLHLQTHTAVLISTWRRGVRLMHSLLTCRLMFFFEHHLNCLEVNHSRVWILRNPPE